MRATKSKLKYVHISIVLFQFSKTNILFNKLNLLFVACFFKPSLLFHLFFLVQHCEFVLDAGGFRPYAAYDGGEHNAAKGASAALRSRPASNSSVHAATDRHPSCIPAPGLASSRTATASGTRVRHDCHTGASRGTTRCHLHTHNTHSYRYSYSNSTDNSGGWRRACASAGEHANQHGGNGTHSQGEAAHRCRTQKASCNLLLYVASLPSMPIMPINLLSCSLILKFSLLLLLIEEIRQAKDF